MHHFHNVQHFSTAGFLVGLLFWWAVIWLLFTAFGRGRSTNYTRNCARYDAAERKARMVNRINATVDARIAEHAAAAKAAADDDVVVGANETE